MTQEEKELLLKDLCVRLSYDVKIQGIVYEDILDRYGDETGAVNEEIVTFTLYIIGKNSIMYNGRWIPLELCKPYLRPMSSITEEERMEFTKLFSKWHDDELFDYIEEGVEFSIWKHKGISPVIFDWLNKKMFDYRGLIPKGLALEAPEGMYNTKTE